MCSQLCCKCSFLSSPCHQQDLLKLAQRKWENREIFHCFSLDIAAAMRIQLPKQEGDEISPVEPVAVVQAHVPSAASPQPTPEKQNYC